MDLYNYSLENYGYDEPIFLSELYENIDANPNTIRQRMNRLANSGKICRYKYRKGVFFIPNPNSVLNKNTLSLNKVITKLYILENKKRIGYVTGLALANKLQLTTQNPVNLELVTNKECQRKREVDYKIRKITLRKPRVEEVNDNNYKILQVFDLLYNFENLSTEPLDKALEKISEYLVDVKISKDEFNKCLKAYPKEAQIRVLENDIFYEITQ